jgi:predicted PurR-regulated permease PerM
VSAALVTLGAYGLLVGAGFWIAPTLARQGREVRAQLPEAIARVEAFLDARTAGLADLVEPGTTTGEASPADASSASASPTPTAAASTEAARPVDADEEDARPSLRDAVGERLRGVTRYVGPVLARTATAVGGLLLITFVAVYLAVEPRTYRRGLLLLVPRRARGRAEEVLEATATTLRRWLVAQLVGMVIIGAVTTGVLLLLQVRAAVALGVLAGLLEFVPFVGPIVAAVPAIAMAFLDSPEKALWVTIAAVVIQQLESNLLMPLLMREGLDLPPILTLLAQGAMALLFGFLGVVVAVPLLAAVVVPVKMLYVRDVVGERVRVPGDDKDAPDDP